MIECAHCGTQNRMGSRYCSNCGQCLNVIPDLVCHACGRLSPSGSAFCQFCGAALSTAAVSRPQAPECAEASRSARQGETGATIPEAGGASRRRTAPKPAGPEHRGSRKCHPGLRLQAARETSGLLCPPSPASGWKVLRPRGKLRTFREQVSEGIGDFAPADGWLPPGSK